MRVLLRLTVLTVLACPGLASADWLAPPISVDAGVNTRFNIQFADNQPRCHYQPWYTYFPYEAHFQATAPIAPAWPNWPPRMTSNMQQQQQQQQPPSEPRKEPSPNGRLSVPVPPGTGPNLGWVPYYPQPAFQQVGYYPPGYYSAPGYWYGR